MQIEYKPGLRIKLIGEFGGIPATVKSVTDQVIIIQFDDLNTPTTRLVEKRRKLETEEEVILEDIVV
jgi:hypothetical protein